MNHKLCNSIVINIMITFCVRERDISTHCTKDIKKRPSTEITCNSENVIAQFLYDRYLHRRKYIVLCHIS